MRRIPFQPPRYQCVASAITLLFLAGSCGDPGARESQLERSSEDVVRPFASLHTPLPPPQPLPPALRRAYGAIVGQRFEEGRNLARNYLKAHPKSAQANVMIGLSYFRSDNFGAARPFLEEALKLDPEYYITHDYLAEALFLLGDLVGARRHYEAFGSFFPNEPKTHVRLGMIDLEETQLERAAQRYGLALDSFEALHKRDPRTYSRQRAERAGVHARLADVHFARNDYELARDELLKATRIAPDNISAFFTLSLVHRRLGQEELADAAAEHYERAWRAIIHGQGKTK